MEPNLENFIPNIFPKKLTTTCFSIFALISSNFSASSHKNAGVQNSQKNIA